MAFSIVQRRTLLLRIDRLISDSSKETRWMLADALTGNLAENGLSVICIYVLEVHPSRYLLHNIVICVKPITHNFTRCACCSYYSIWNPEGRSILSCVLYCGASAYKREFLRWSFRWCGIVRIWWSPETCDRCLVTKPYCILQTMLDMDINKHEHLLRIGSLFLDVKASYLRTEMCRTRITNSC